jgi:hypothetical protein
MPSFTFIRCVEYVDDEEITIALIVSFNANGFATVVGAVSEVSTLRQRRSLIHK